MMNCFIVIMLISQFLHAADYRIFEKQAGSAKLSFVRNAEAEKDQKGEEKFYNAKADFSTVEKMAPLTRIALSALTPEAVKSLSHEEFNQLYARLSSGPMLNGDFKGFVLQKSPLFTATKKKLLKYFHLGGPLAATATGVCQNNEDCFVELIWKGKRFSAENSFGQIEAQTLLNQPLGSLTLFPMNTYCGISQIDSRRESQIVDGNFSDDFGDYVPLRDEVVTRKQLSITEEYRMVKPGLYIGKVYSNKIFLFNVALEKQIISSTESANACFDSLKNR